MFYFDNFVNVYIPRQYDETISEFFMLHIIFYTINFFRRLENSFAGSKRMFVFIFRPKIAF